MSERLERTAREREDHILDCYETIKARDAEIKRLLDRVEMLKNALVSEIRLRRVLICPRCEHKFLEQ